MKIGIDIDDTLVNTKEKQIMLWKEYYQKNPNTKYTKELPQNINDFGDEYIDSFWEIYREELLKVTYKKDCSETLNKLTNDGYKLCIVTSRPKEKYNNLIEQTLKDFEINKIPIQEIHTNIKNKALFCKNNKIDILIDDSIKHCENALKEGITAILFNNNSNYRGYQTNNWKKVYSIIKNIK